MNFAGSGVVHAVGGVAAPCAFVDPIWAAFIGVSAGVIVVLAVGIVEKVGIDDAVGAISVHGVCGIYGVLSVGLFANGKYGAGWNATTEGSAANATGVTGLFYDTGLGGRQLIAQAIGALVICTVIFGVAYAFFKIQDMVTKGGIRSEEADEIVGVDLPEMGVFAYPEFILQDPMADQEPIPVD